MRQVYLLVPGTAPALLRGERERNLHCFSLPSSLSLSLAFFLSFLVGTQPEFNVMAIYQIQRREKREKKKKCVEMASHGLCLRVELVDGGLEDGLGTREDVARVHDVLELCLERREHQRDALELGEDMLLRGRELSVLSLQLVDPRLCCCQLRFETVLLPRQGGAEERQLLERGRARWRIPGLLLLLLWWRC